MNSTDEYVSEALVTFDRVKTLVYDLLVCEAWKEKVFPHLEVSLSKISSVKKKIFLVSNCLFNLVRNLVDRI